MINPDIRWHQRLNNYNKAFDQLSLAVALAKSRELSELEKQGLVQAFEFTHELAWNVMKDYFYFQGNAEITGSRDAVRESFHKGLIENGEVWMEMIKSRNQTSHTYNHAIVEEITTRIIHDYHQAFQLFLNKMQELKNNE